MRGRRGIVWAVPMLLVVAVVAAVLLLGGTGDTGPDRSAGGSSAAATPTPTSTGKVDPDTWCAAFRAFADAQAQYVAAPEDPQAQAGLQDSADALLGLGEPLGLGAGGFTSLQLLVDGSLDQAGDPTTAPGGAAPDDAALNTYLGTACPA